MRFEIWVSSGTPTLTLLLISQRPCTQGPFLPHKTRQKIIPGPKPRHSEGLSVGQTSFTHETSALRYGSTWVHLQSLTQLPGKGPCAQGLFLTQMTRQKIIPGPEPRHSEGVSVGQTSFTHETSALRYGPPQVHLHSRTYLPDQGPCAHDPNSTQRKRQKVDPDQKRRY